jgi:transcriptional regulator with XRE-family HTH domain
MENPEEMTASACVSANVKTLRKSQGLTLKDLSGRLADVGHHMGIAALSKLELGDRGVDVDDVAALANVFGTSTDLLMRQPKAAVYDETMGLLAEWEQAWAERAQHSEVLAMAQSRVAEADARIGGLKARIGVLSRDTAGRQACDDWSGRRPDGGRNLWHP